MPIEGYYEWQAIEGRRTKTPYFIHAADGGPVMLAGLTSLWRDELLTFTIATRASEGNLAPIHDREPVILTPDLVDPWLNPKLQDSAEVSDLLRQARPEMSFHEVSTMVNTPRNNTPSLVEPAGTPPLA